MNQNLDKKIELKNKLISLLRENKFKITIFCGLIILLAAILVFFKIHNENKNSLISQKYIQAGLYLSSNEIEDAKKIYEEIILSKNKFYSILALNTIIEKKLFDNPEKILNFFEIVEGINYSEEKKDLVIFKKALYLLKISKIKEGNDLLNNLIKKDSRIKILAEEIIEK